MRGEGTRLRPLTNYFQKTMIPIGTRKRPLLEYIVRLMIYNGVRDITLLTGYRSEEIERYFEDGSRLGARISYSRDPKSAEGSAKALSHAIVSGNVGSFQDLAVYYGDVLSALDVRGLLDKHRKEKAVVTLVLSRDYKVPVGIADVVDGRVRSFREKPVLPLNATVGGLVVSREAVPVLERVTSGRGPVDIMAHFVPAVIKAGMRVSPFYIDGFWYDVGTTEAYEKLDDELVDTKLKYLD